MKKFIPVSNPFVGEEEKINLIECIETNWLSSGGPFVTRLENEFSLSIGRKFGIAVANGSGALDIALKGVGINAGDEVIIPSFTIVSPLFSVLRCGAIPVFVDVDMYNWNMKVEDIRALITAKTKAIIVAHTYGLPVDMDPVLELCREFDLLLIEDAAEAHGLDYDSKPCGSFGDVSTFSFYSNKFISTGEGGMILTDNEKYQEKFRSLRNLSFRPNERFVHDDIGWNYRMTNLQAAVGVAQLSKLPHVVKVKRSIGELYSRLLKDVNEINLPLKFANKSENVFWVYGITIKEEIDLSAYELAIQLKDYGIDTRPFFYPLHMQPFLNKKLIRHNNIENASFLYKKGLYLPSGPNINEEDVVYVAEKLKEVIVAFLSR